MIEHSFKSGAAGLFINGCQMGDCHFREGNKWLQGRLLSLVSEQRREGIYNEQDSPEDGYAAADAYDDHSCHFCGIVKMLFRAKGLAGNTMGSCPVEAEDKEGLTRSIDIGLNCGESSAIGLPFQPREEMVCQPHECQGDPSNSAVIVGRYLGVVSVYLK